MEIFEPVKTEQKIITPENIVEVSFWNQAKLARLTGWNHPASTIRRRNAKVTVALDQNGMIAAVISVSFGNPPEVGTTPA